MFPPVTGETMTPSEIVRVEAYLRSTFGNTKIKIVPPKKKDAPIEVLIGGGVMLVPGPALSAPALNRRCALGIMAASLTKEEMKGTSS